MPSAFYINDDAELRLARQEATNVIENHIYADRGVPASLEQADAWLREAQAEAARVFHAPDQLATLLADLALHNPSLAHILEVTVQDRLTAWRTTAPGMTPQPPDAVADQVTPVTLPANAADRSAPGSQ